MKQTMALLGLLFIGLTLLFSPSVGVLGWSSAGLVAPDVTATSPALVVDDPPQGAASAPTTAAPESTPDTTSESPANTSSTEATPPATSSATSAPTTTESPAPSAVVAGSVASSRFGPFQVEVTIESGVIVDVELIQQPGDRRSLSINQQAVPLYEEAVLEIQGADIDVISGATVTWRGYTASLQAALDEAGIG